MDAQEYRSVTFKVNGNPQSKANSRRIVWVKRQNRLASIKSKRAIEYVGAFKRQVPDLSRTLNGLMTGDVSVQIDIWYQSARSDLDESIILDCMQGSIYENDRQVKYKSITHRGIDKQNPRACIVVTEIGKPRIKRNAKKK